MDIKGIATRLVILIAAIAFGIWEDFSAIEWIILASFLLLVEAIGFLADKYEWEWAKEPEDATWLDNWGGLIFVCVFFGSEYSIQYFYPDVSGWHIFLGLIIIAIVIAGIVE